MQIEGAAAIVVGGGSGLGAATARALHARGASVSIVDRDERRGGALAAELGGAAVCHPADVTREHELAAAMAAAAAAPGGLRVAVCCAGVGWVESTASRRGPHAAQSFETVIAVNALGTFNALRLAAAAMRDNEPDAAGGRGVCVLTASIAAFDGQRGQLAYAASKGAVASMTLPAARDLAPRGIRVCTIAPGSFDTPLLAGLPQSARETLAAAIPFPSRLGRPEEFAALVSHVVENDMLNGEVIRLDGAMRMAA